MWDEDSSPGASFMRQLLWNQGQHLMKSTVYAHNLRHQPELAARHQKIFGHVWKSAGTDVFGLIASAYGEDWGRAPDAPKKPCAVNQKDKHNDDLVGAREKCAQEREHQLQGVPEASERVVEEAQGGACAKESG